MCVNAILYPFILSVIWGKIFFLVYNELSVTSNPAINSSILVHPVHQLKKITLFSLQLETCLQPWKK